jgi:hypothetical protein
MADYVLRGGKERKLLLCVVLIDYYDVRLLTKCWEVE